MEPEDAEQTAVIGLIEAARRFDPDRGYQFSTYATHWVRNACQRYGLEWGLPIHVPSYCFWTCYKLSLELPRLIAAHGPHDARELFQECMKEAGVTPQQWRHFCLARHFCRFSDLDRRELARLDRPDESSPVVEDNGCLSQDIRRAMQTLHPRQIEVLKLRYGFEGPRRTLQEVADRLGLTRERIRQIQAGAEKKLRRMLHRFDRHGVYGDPEVEVAEDSAEEVVEQNP